VTLDEFLANDDSPHGITDADLPDDLRRLLITFFTEWAEPSNWTFLAISEDEYLASLRTSRSPEEKEWREGQRFFHTRLQREWGAQHKLMRAYLLGNLPELLLDLPDLGEMLNPPKTRPAGLEATLLPGHGKSIRLAQRVQAMLGSVLTKLRGDGRGRADTSADTGGNADVAEWMKKVALVTGGDEAIRMLAIATDKAKTADQRQREIHGLDSRVLVWTSAQ